MNPPSIEFDVYLNDLTQFQVIDEKSLVNALKFKYEKGDFYCFMGEHLIAINPGKQLRLYADNTRSFFLEPTLYRFSQTPHLYWTCSQVYRSACEKRNDHSIVLNGESGSGKTETFKYAVDFFAKSYCKDELLKNRINQAISILEPLGNATTLANSNSSRFSNFFKLKFNQEGVLYAAEIKDFMLEKSRVILGFPNERNFLIFYYLIAGIKDQNMVYLSKIGKHKAIQMREPLSNQLITLWSDSFNRWQNQCISFGFTIDQLNTVYRLLAAVIHLNDVELELEKAQFEYLRVENLTKLKTTAILLNLNEETLIRNVFTFGSNTMRNSLAWEIYSRVFGWFIETINNLMKPNETSQPAFTISLLDTPGFENFEKNSFEQLVANALSDALQRSFYRHSFEIDQQLYIREGLNYPEMTYNENNNTFDMLFGQNGVFNIIDKIFKQLNNTNDNDNKLNVVQKLNEYFGQRREYIEIESNDGTDLSFGVNHHAGEVKYMFIRLNQFCDESSEKVRKCVYQSTDPFISNLFSARSPSTASFSKVAIEMIDEIVQSKPVFIKCLKPNSISNRFDQSKIEKQIRGLKLVEYVKLLQQTYPVKIDIAAFLKSFEKLRNFYMVNSTSASASDSCIEFLKKSSVCYYTIGRNMIFMKYEELDKLNYKQNCLYISRDPDSTYIENFPYTSPWHFLSSPNISSPNSSVIGTTSQQQQPPPNAQKINILTSSNQQNDLRQWILIDENNQQFGPFSSKDALEKYRCVKIKKIRNINQTNDVTREQFLEDTKY